MYEQAFAEAMKSTFEPLMESQKELSEDDTAKVLRDISDKLLPAFTETLGGGDSDKAMDALGLSFVLHDFDGTKDSCCRALLRLQIVHDVFQALDKVSEELKEQVAEV